jgi:signal transduction histidine kinase
MLAGSTSEEPLPADTEARLADFTELIGIAIAGAQARAELRGYAEEQAALRRVATLVAGGTPPEGVFGAVAGEAGRLLGVDLTGVARYDAAGMATSVGLWSKTGTSRAVTIGDQLSLGGRNVTTMVFQTGQPARIDDYDNVSGECGDAGRSMGFGSAAGVPVRAAGRLWGVIVVGSAYPARLPTDAEARLAGFTELVATAIANAEAQGALAASRARIITAGDEARRRMERDLHDGAQQRLVTLGLRLRELQAAASPGDGELARGLDDAAAGLKVALEELREIARGIHPGALADGGLYLALKALTRRSTVPVTLHVQIPGRLPAPVEIAAYYIVSETLTNVTRHADARTADVEVVADEDALRVRVRDDGRGGATLGHGSGLVGLMDRVEAFNGQLMLHSPPGKGTTLEAHIPVQRSYPPAADGHSH